MAEKVDERHLTGILGTVGKSIAAMPEGRRVVEQMRVADSPQDLLFVLRSADLGVDEPAKRLVCDAATDERHWEEVKGTLLRSAELQLAERYSSNA